MIEITCSKKQKTTIIDALAHNGLPCIFPRCMNRCMFDMHMSCQNCLEKKIKWHITPSKSKKKA